MRIPKPHWKESHKCFYVKLGGRFIRLDPDKAKSYDLYRELLSRYSMSEGLKPAAKVTAADVLAAYLDYVRTHRKPATFKWYQQFIAGTCGKTGKFRDAGFMNYLPPELLARDLKPLHFTRWLDWRYPPARVSKTTIESAKTAIKQAFIWAKDEGYLDSNPLASLKRAKRRRTRGKEAFLTPEQWQQIIATIKAGPVPRWNESFLDLLVVMHETGCRPQELRAVEARHLDHAGKRWVFPVEESKSGEKTNDQRIVHLGKEAYEVCKRLAIKNPEGPIFRTVDGVPWNKFALADRFRKLSAKLGWKVYAYMIRHTFATEAMRSGVDLISIAGLMGHADLTMLKEIYEHVTVDQDHMEAARKKASGRASA